MSRFSHQPTADATSEQDAATRVEQLYANHSGVVRSICRSLLRDRSEAEDAVQQTFLSAHRSLLNGSSPRDAAAWLATIARHEALARVHTRMRESLPVDAAAEPSGPDAHSVAVQRQEVGEIRAQLAKLPSQQREAILLREVRGFSYEEVASSLSVTTSAVESLLFRARRNLQVRLRDALAAFSPAELVRELAARLGGGFAVPTATKALAVGVGAAVIAGGVVDGPRIAGLGHAPQSRPSASAEGIHRHAQPQPAFKVPARSGKARPRVAPITGATPIRHHAKRSDQVETPSSGGSDGVADSSTASVGEKSGASDGGETSGRDTQTTSSGGDAATSAAASQTGDSQPTTETTTTTQASDGPDG
jgi:RNA polymerase sigma factor (sigma-70 family)